MESNPPNDGTEPTPIGEILQDPDAIIGAPPDEQRAADVAQRDLENERAEKQREIDELWEEMKAGRVSEEAGVPRLDALKHDLLAIDVDRIAARQKNTEQP